MAEDYDQEQAIKDYTRLMEAGSQASNEEALQALIEQAYAHNMYFDYDREKGSYVLRYGNDPDLSFGRPDWHYHPDPRVIDD